MKMKKKNVVRGLQFQGGGTKILQISLIFQATTERIPGFVFDFLSALMALPSHHVQPDFSRVLVALLVTDRCSYCFFLVYHIYTI